MSLYQRFKKKLPTLGRFAEGPAAMIDRAYRDEPKSFFGHVISFIKRRAIYTFLFLPLAAVDLVVAGVLGSFYAFATFFSSDERQSKNIEQLRKYSTIFSKNFYTLALALFGFMSPKLTAFYFIPEKTDSQGVSAGGGLHHSAEAELSVPNNIEELQNLIKKGGKVIPVGAGRSQGRQFLPEEGKKTTVVDLSKFNDIKIDPVNKTATVGAGARWSDVQLKANKKELALQVMQASNVFSLGGSIGTNIHGWDHIQGCLSNTILSMDIIDANGELQTVKPEDELFELVAGGLGLFGTVVRATIQLTDNELLSEKGTQVAPENYVEHFYKEVQDDEQTKLHLYRLSLDPDNLLSSGVAVSYKKEDDSPPLRTPNLQMEGRRGTRFNQVMINLMRRIGFLRKKYWEGEEKRLLANDSPAMTRNEIMQPPINAMFNPSVSEAEWLQEYFLPGEQLDSFLKELATILMDNEVVLLNATVRFVKQQDKNPLSYAHDGDRFAVVLCFNQSLKESHIIKAKKWLREAQHLAVVKGGSYYLPYQHVSSPEDFNAAYPHAEEAREAKQAVDPNGVFSNGLYEKYLAAKPPETNHFKEIMFDESTKKEFEGFLKNVLKRIDSTKFFALLEDILKYNDSHAEIYQELCHRLPEIMPSNLRDLKHILNSLSAIKGDLAAQVHAILPDNLKTIDGLVEIGYPGRFVDGFKKQYKVTGNIVAVNDAESITDYLQTGFPRPYHQFETLDYQAPSLAGLEENSADVITCYVGLHHFPEDKLNEFLADVRRVLRPDGHFLLVDHDIEDEKSLSMAHMAHTVFNAVTGVSLEVELSEYRNFQSMSYWRERLAQNGLGDATKGPDVPMIRQGDPSRNRMVSFHKAPVPELKPHSEKHIVNENELERNNSNIINLDDDLEKNEEKISKWNEYKDNSTPVNQSEQSMFKTIKMINFNQIPVPKDQRSYNPSN